MRTAGAEKQGWGFTETKRPREPPPAVGWKMNPKETRQVSNSSQVKSFGGGIFKGRASSFSCFVIVRTRCNWNLVAVYCRPTTNDIRETPRTPAEVRLRMVAGGQRIERRGKRHSDHAASRAVNCSRSPHGTGTMSYCSSDVSTPAGMPLASFKSTKHSDAAGRVSRVSIQLKANCLA